MAIEEGIVTRLGMKGPDATAWVKIVRSGACESCSSRHSCNVVGSGQDHEVEAANDARARIGDRIQITMATRSLLKATFLLYLFPIICMILGGFVGHWISDRISGRLMISGSVIPVLMSLAALALAMAVVRFKGRRMGEDKAYQPRILRVIGRGPLGPSNSENGVAV